MDGATSCADAAACFAGQARTVEQSWRPLGQLLSGFDDTTHYNHSFESVVFLNLQDSSKGGKQLHSLGELRLALNGLRASALQLYNASTYYDLEAASKRLCWSSQPGHYSHHFVQLWTIGRCFSLLLERQAAARCSSRPAAYEWTLRMRPDTTLPTKSDARAALSAITTRPPVSHGEAWLGRGVGADRFVLLRRPAQRALAEASLLRAFHHGTACGSPDAAHWRLSSAERLKCIDGHVPSWGVECYLIVVMMRAGVAVHFDDRLKLPLTRDTPIHATNGRRLHDATPRDPPQRPVRSARPLAICICGQGRTFMHVAPNLLTATARLRAEDADVFLAIDRARGRSSAYPGKSVPRLAEKPLLAAAARFKPAGLSVVEVSKGLDETLRRCFKLIVTRERKRGEYAFVLRLRTDLAFKAPLPRLSAFPRPTRPRLWFFSDYLSAGTNSSRCGPTKTVPPELLARHGLCADDNIAFMPRAVAPSYFRHWYWKPECAGTPTMPKKAHRVKEGKAQGVARRLAESIVAVGKEGRLGCIECRLGCELHRAGVTAIGELSGLREHCILRPHARPDECVRIKADGASLDLQPHAFEWQTGRKRELACEGECDAELASAWSTFAPKPSGATSLGLAAKPL